MPAGTNSYNPGPLEVEKVYCWRVDEVYSGNPVKGPVWSFTVGFYLLVEDFESYTDDDAAGGAIWQTWIDGFGVADVDGAARLDDGRRCGIVALVQGQFV
jgi:hypothetical protein